MHGVCQIVTHAVHVSIFRQKTCRVLLDAAGAVAIRYPLWRNLRGHFSTRSDKLSTTGSGLLRLLAPGASGPTIVLTPSRISRNLRSGSRLFLGIAFAIPTSSRTRRGRN